MHVTPHCDRDEIARTKEAVAQLSLEAGAQGQVSGRHIVRQRMLLRQLAALEQGLARAEREWAQAQARDQQQYDSIRGPHDDASAHHHDHPQANRQARQ